MVARLGFVVMEEADLTLAEWLLGQQQQMTQ